MDMLKEVDRVGKQIAKEINTEYEGFELTEGEEIEFYFSGEGSGTCKYDLITLAKEYNVDLNFQQLLEEKKKFYSAKKKKTVSSDTKMG